MQWTNKPDYGEDDPDVLPRDGLPKWGNPLHWKDDGNDDDVVVTQTDGSDIVIRRNIDDLVSRSLMQREIYDADGDGVEDNIHKTYDELDRFYIPNRYFPSEDIYNTHHGNLPGHVRKSEYEGPPEYWDPWAGEFSSLGQVPQHLRI